MADGRDAREAAGMGEDVNPLERMRVDLASFSGPLDLLLHLIRKNRIDILDIPMAEITRQYLEYLKLMREVMDMEVASEFLVMAATLIHIKSRMLLPPAEGEDGEDGEDGVDPREELVRRLLEYQKYRKAADDIDRRPTLGRDVFLHPPESPPRGEAADEGEGAEPEAPYREASIFQLVDAFSRVLVAADRRRPVQLELESFHLQDAVDMLEKRFRGERDLRFQDLFTADDSRRRVITIFLALLELIKREKLRALQPETHGTLRLFAAEGWPGDTPVRIAEPQPQALSWEDAAEDGAARAPGLFEEE
jgi:segregation and condensation protein A